MEPLRPEAKRAILNATPQAEPEIDEYERLLAERFTIDPDAPAPQPGWLSSRTSDREQRLQDLHPQGFCQGQERLIAPATQAAKKAG